MISDSNASKSALWPRRIAALFAATLLAHLTGFVGQFNYDDISEMINNDAYWNLARWDRVLLALPGRPVVGVSLALDYALYGRARLLCTTISSILLAIFWRLSAFVWDCAADAFAAGVG